MASASLSEFFCHSCKEGKKEVKARAFCYECRSLLCEPCAVNHKRLKNTAEHHLIDLVPSISKSTLNRNRISTSKLKQSSFSEHGLTADFRASVTLKEDTNLHNILYGAAESTSVTSKPEESKASKHFDPRRLKATKCLEFSVSRPEDEEKVLVLGVLRVADKIVVVDFGNSMLKMFDQNGTYISSTKLNDRTRGITNVDDKNFATSGDGSTVCLWTVHGQTVIRQIISYQVGQDVSGIHFNGTYYCLLSSGDHVITILERQGRQVRKIIIKQAFGRKFDFGLDIHMDSDTNNVFLPCCREDGVLCMTIEGKAVWFTPLYGPWGITEIQGTLCVTGSVDDCLHLITKEGEYIKSLMDKEDLGGKPYHICCGEDDKLTIVAGRSHDTFVYVMVCSSIVNEDCSGGKGVFQMRMNQHGQKEESLSLIRPMTEEYAKNVMRRLSRTYKDASLGVYERPNDPNHLVVIGYDATMISDNKIIAFQEEGIEVIIKHPFNIIDEALRVSNFTRENMVSDKKSNLALIRDCIQSNASKLWSGHSNLTIITGDFVKSRRGEHIVKPCVVLYCLSKGFIPLHEDAFPSQLYCAMGSVETDVREGYFVAGPSTLRGDAHSYNDPICMGSSIGSCMRDVSGSLGLFVDLPNQEKGFLTCCHVLFDCIYPRPFKYKLVSGDVEHKVIQPGNSAFCSRSDKICGTIQRAVFRPRSPNTSSVSVDAALVKVTSRLPSTGHFVIQTILQAKESGYSEVNLPIFQSGAVRRVLTQADRDRPLLKSGTSSGLTKSYFKLDGAQVRISGEGVALGINDATPIVMQGQYEVNSDSIYAPFFIPGDSGSAVFVKETTGSLTCVGIAIGKTSYGTAIVTPIGAVLDELHLKDTDVTTFP